MLDTRDKFVLHFKMISPSFPLFGKGFQILHFHSKFQETVGTYAQKPSFALGSLFTL